jgi:hypothetical protein
MSGMVGRFQAGGQPKAPDVRCRGSRGREGSYIPRRIADRWPRLLDLPAFEQHRGHVREVEEAAKAA